ncbi:MAG: hypothetical protein ABJN62_07590 [Halioglobus sp.]
MLDSKASGKRCVMLAAFAMLAARPDAVSAEDVEIKPIHPYLIRKHTFFVGAFFQEAHAEIRETVGPLPRTAVNLGHLGVDETDTTWHIEYQGRLWDRWGLAVGAENFSSRGTIENGTEFNFDRITYPVGANLRTTMDVDTYFFDVVYQAYRNDRAELNVGLGIHAFEFDVEIEGTVAGGRERFFGWERGRAVGASDLLAPLPNLRASGFFALNSRWSVAASVGWFSANVDEWDGRFLYLHARTHFLVTERFGISAGYQRTDVDVKREQRRRESRYDIEFTGPTVHLTYGF